MKTTKSRLKGLVLSRGELEDIRATLAERIREGLKKEEGEIGALPTYLAPPGAGGGGEALVIDIGGTNIRAAGIRMTGSGTVVISPEPATTPLVSEWDSAASFFDRQAELALFLGPASNLPIGYCFSYPFRAMPGGDAVLLYWTKQLNVPGVAGHKVGEMLLNAFRKRGYRPRWVRVLNDTVAALMGGDLAFRKGGRFATFIGLIVGTGTNMAAYFPTSLLAAKVSEAEFGHAKMAVNLESGNYHPPHLTRFDDELDATYPHVGEHRLEKAVSGKFLPQLYTFIRDGRSTPPFPTTRELFELARQRPETPDSALARAIVNRSADLVAACLAGLIDTLETEGRVGILGEGGVINNNPEYRERLTRQLATLLGDSPEDSSRFDILQLENVNLIGAAAAAL
ncbi:MAG: hypothetical protein V1789_06265 [PVC group bacterium]